MKGGTTLILAAVLLVNAATLPGQENIDSSIEAEKEPATISVAGHGLFGNRYLRKSLAILQIGDQFPEVLDANFVEDSILILLSTLAEEGYLEAEIRTLIHLSDGREIDRSWTALEEVQLPRPLRADKVRFEIRSGVRFHYGQLRFEGLQALTDRAAQRYFLEIDTLLRLKRSRIFTPERLKRSLENLQLVLQRLGFHEAVVEAAQVEQDQARGRVDVLVRVQEGPRWWVRSVTTELKGSDQGDLLSTNTVYPNSPFSSLWKQDFLQEWQVKYYLQGYPDAEASIVGTNQAPMSATNYLDLEVALNPGPRIRMGELEFKGLSKTRRGVVENRIQLDEGEWLNRVEVDRARLRLARLGVFDSVDLAYEASDSVADTRDVIFNLSEGKRVDFHLLFGYGSYELLRGGFELDQHNLFGLAHHSRLRAIQSFKATMADYLYSVPDLGGKDLNLFFNASGLRREEVSFEREELLLGLGSTRTFDAIDSDIGVRYNYEFLNATDSDIGMTADEEVVRVAAIVLDFKHDRRDSPLSPTRGYKFLADLELASAELGGEVDFQRLEIAASWHWGMGGGRYWHLGFSHGAAMTLDSDDDDLPLNKRFFPGGESSIRGFQQGEASPRDEAGDLIGAETYALGNIEFEQKLTRSVSLVVLFDALGIARDLENYPYNETLYTVGGGLWWKTMVGPVRVEYGHNLNPRRKDPRGTLHFTLGFPF